MSPAREDNTMAKGTERRKPIAPTAVVCLILFLSPLVAGKLTPIPSLAIQMLVLLAAMLWMARAAREGILRIPGRLITYSLAAFAVLLVISAIGSASLHATIRELANIASYLLVFLMVVSIRGNRPAFYGVLASLMMSAWLVGILGIKEYLLAPNSGWRVFSTFFNPDFLAGFMALILPIALAWYLSRVSPGYSIGLGVIALLVFSSLLLTGSRFGALTAVGGVAVFLLLAFFSGTLRKAHLVRIAFLLPMIVLIYLSFNRPLAGRVSATQSQSHSGGFRILTWQGTARMAAANPINGTGLGTFEIAYPKYALVGFTKLTHNSYLQLAAEAGPLAAVSLIVLLGSSSLPLMVTLIKKRVPEDREFGGWMPEARLMSSGLLGGAAACMARNLVDSDWYITAIGISFWAVLGMVVALSDVGRIVQFTSRRRWALTGVAGLVILGLASMLAAELSAARGTAVWAKEPESAIRLYRVASKLDPLNAEFHQRLASAYLSIAQASGDPTFADSAKGELKQAIRLEPMSGKSYYRLGRVYEFYPKNKEAVAAFSRALDRSPNAVEVMYALANRYEADGQSAEALNVWRSMVALEDTPFEQVRAVPEMVQPEYIFAHIELGRDMEQQGDKARAEKEYKLALDRIERYQECVEAMREVLEVSGRRDPQMERRVEEARLEVIESLNGLLFLSRPIL